MNLDRCLKILVEWITNEGEDCQLWERLAQDLLKKFWVWYKNRLFWDMFKRPGLPVAKRLWGCYWGRPLRRRAGSPGSPKPSQTAGSCREQACASWTSLRFCSNFAIYGIKGITGSFGANRHMKLRWGGYRRKLTYFTSSLHLFACQLLIFDVYFVFFPHLPKSCLNSFWNERSKCCVSPHLWYKVLRWGWRTSVLCNCSWRGQLGHILKPIS